MQAGACRLNRLDPATVEPEHTPRSPAAKDAGGLRVVTYNVHMESAPAIAEVIRSNAQLAEADVLFLQEIESHGREDASRAEQVASLLGMEAAYAPGYGLPGGGSHGVAILSRYALRDIRVIELPRYHVVVNSARRVALAATMTLAGAPVRLISVHLDNRINPKKRRRQLEPVLREAKKTSGALVVAGDLNTSPFCWAGALIPIPCGRQDNAVERAVHDAGLSAPVRGLGATSKWLGMRLDAIYTRGLSTTDADVERGERLSDHYPVWAEFALVREPSR